MFERKGQKEEVPTVVAATLQEIKDTLEQIKGKNPERAAAAEDQHMTEDEDINDEDFETPTFGDWVIISSIRCCCWYLTINRLQCLH
jgi:hypothetical protein